MSSVYWLEMLGKTRSKLNLTEKHIFHVINCLKYAGFESKLSVAWMQQEICKAAFESVERGSL